MWNYSKLEIGEISAISAIFEIGNMGDETAGTMVSATAGTALGSSVTGMTVVG